MKNEVNQPFLIFSMDCKLVFLTCSLTMLLLVTVLVSGVGCIGNRHCLDFFTVVCFIAIVLLAVVVAGSTVGSEKHTVLLLVLDIVAVIALLFLLASMLIPVSDTLALVAATFLPTSCQLP